MTARKLFLCAGVCLGLTVAACEDSDIGKACAKASDCGTGLICDVHDGKGTCQEPHGHDEGGETEHESEGHETDHHDSEH